MRSKWQTIMAYFDVQSCERLCVLWFIEMLMFQYCWLNITKLLAKSRKHQINKQRMSQVNHSSCTMLCSIFWFRAVFRFIRDMLLNQKLWKYSRDVCFILYALRCYCCCVYLETCMSVWVEKLLSHDRAVAMPFSRRHQPAIIIEKFFVSGLLIGYLLDLQAFPIKAKSLALFSEVSAACLLSYLHLASALSRAGCIDNYFLC